MRKIIVLGFMFLFLVSFGLAEKESKLSFVEDLDKSLPMMVGQEMPGFMATLFGDEKINLHITLNDDKTKTLGMVTIDGKFSEVKKTALSEPTLNVYTSEKAIKEITSSAKPLKALQKALDDNKITYKAVGVGKKIKFGLSSILLKIASWFN